MVDLATDDRVEEVRLAMALNGGVSLAVWMGGCAVEIDAARRAHLPSEGRSVYAALCRAFMRVVVVDVMSGASAGGINGAMLGAAIVHRRRLEPDFVRDRWLKLGDFTELLHRTSKTDARSLMQGDIFTTELEATFDHIVYKADFEDDGAQSRAKADVKLDITTTDLIGEPVRFVDFWGESLEAREYRARFRFRHAGDFKPKRLARAARSSASFPLAFEPFKLSGEDTGLTGLSGPRWVVDGGLLDNAPIAAAIDLIPGRNAWRQVRRFVVYVNADPPGRVDVVPGEPTLAGIAGHIVSLPRKAPFVDQLYAVEKATRHGFVAKAEPDLGLLKLPAATLVATAQPLLQAYRRQRTLTSLDELIGSPGAATELLRASPDLSLPWIPQTLEPCNPDGKWQWGTRPAQRALHLLLDAIRRAVLEQSAAADRERLLKARAEVGRHLARLDARRGGILGSAEPLAAALAAFEHFDPLPRIQAAVEATLSVADLLRDGDVPTLFAPFDATVEPDAPREHYMDFVRRALAIEVIRRAEYAGPDIESGQELRFVQLTPHAPGLLFAPLPWGHDTGEDQDEDWAKPREKLLGIRLAHFGGFYRGSWRVNDFMWGRMDAAARLVDMLVAPGRVKQLGSESWVGKRAWDVLATALTDGADEMELQLLTEALATMPADYPRPAADLYERLSEALKYDLTLAAEPTPRGQLTRIVCTRAAQFEIFREELPQLNDASEHDAKAGGGTPPLKLGSSPADALEDLREGKTLLKRLLADDEVTSDLALRTGAHAGLVALGALRAAKMPMARGLFALRALLLPVAGTVALAWRDRFGVWLAFTAAAMVIAARIVDTDPKLNAVELEGRWATYLLLSLIAVLVVIGAATVPALRFLRGKLPKQRFFQALKAVGLLTTGIAGAALTGVWGGGLSWAQLVAAPGALGPPTWLMGIVIGLVAGLPIVIVPALLRGLVDTITAQPWGGWMMLVLFGSACVLAGGASFGPLLDAWDGETWQQAVAAFALPGAPVVAFACLRLWRKGMPKP